MNYVATAASDTARVLRNTYALLSMTLIWSAFCSYLTIDANMTAGAVIACFVGSLILLFALMAFRNSAMAIPLVFAFTGVMGAMMGPAIGIHLAMDNGTQTVMMAMGGTGVIFIALSAYALISKEDYSAWGGFLMCGLLVLLGLMIGNLFFQIPALDMAISAMAVLLFSALILFDTSRIVNGGETNYVMATVSLYLDILNLFLHLLNLLSGD